MITEIAQIEIKPGTEKDYEAAIAKAVALPPRHLVSMASSCIVQSRNPNDIDSWQDGIVLKLTMLFENPQLCRMARSGWAVLRRPARGRTHRDRRFDVLS